jgi:hypothetical protein
LNNLCGEGCLSACCFIGAYTASTFCGLSAVWAYTITIVDKISAVYATRLIFFCHSLRLCHTYVAEP